MPTPRGRHYLLRESSNPMDPQQFTTTLTDIQTQLNAQTQDMNQTQES